MYLWFATIERYIATEKSFAAPMNQEPATIDLMGMAKPRKQASRNRYIVAMYRYNPTFPLFLEVSTGFTGANRW